MRTKQLAFCAALAPLFFGSCFLHIGGSGRSDSGEWKSSLVSSKASPSTVARENRAGLDELAVGMPIDEVRGVMCEGWTKTLASPYRQESFPAADGARAEILYYYTNTYDSDGLVTDDELTPIFFEDGLLVGWGTIGFEPWKRRVLGE